MHVNYAYSLTVSLYKSFDDSEFMCPYTILMINDAHIINRINSDF